MKIFPFYTYIKRFIVVELLLAPIFPFLLVGVTDHLAVVRCCLRPPQLPSKFSDCRSGDDDVEPLHHFFHQHLGTHVRRLRHLFINKIGMILCVQLGQASDLRLFFI